MRIPCLPFYQTPSVAVVDISNPPEWCAHDTAKLKIFRSTTLIKMSKALTFASVAATGVLAYALYFDYSRRNSPAFRKQLKKKHAQQQKDAKKAVEQSRQAKIDAVKAALASELAADPLPTDLSKKENFFMEQVASGEQLANNPDTHMDAAVCFYKALAVYPNPTDILGIYQKTVPEEVYELVVMMIAFQPPATITNIMGGPGGISGAASAASAAAATVEEVKPSDADLD